MPGATTAGACALTADEDAAALQAIAILRQAGLRGALVSSSGDDGQQRLVAEAPDPSAPELRPYRIRSEIGSWMRDDTVPRFSASPGKP